MCPSVAARSARWPRAPRRAGPATATVPAGIPLGTYDLIACADDQSAVPLNEADENNNCLTSSSTVTVTRPDLVTASVTSPPPLAAPGTSFTVRDTVTNQGLRASVASTTRYYLSANPQRDPAPTDLLLSGSRAVPALAPGASSPGPSISVGFPSSTPLGVYYLLACADDALTNTELDEANNCLASAATLQVTRPNLQETSVTALSSSVRRGGSFHVRDTVTNQGLIASGPSTTRYYLSIDQVRDPGAVDIFVGSRAVPGLAPAAASSAPTAGVSVTVPAGTTPASYHVIACADDTAVVGETAEADNCLATGTTINVTL